MNKRLLISVFASALLGAALVTAIQRGVDARAAHIQQALAVQDASAPLSNVQASAPFRVRELHELPSGYRLVTSALRDAPTGARNALSVVLSYRGPDGGLLELTEIPLNMTLDRASVITVAGRSVQFVEHHPPDGATTRSYMWRDDDVSLQLNVYIPQTAASTLTPAVLERILAATR